MYIFVHLVQQLKNKLIFFIVHKSLLCINNQTKECVIQKVND